MKTSNRINFKTALRTAATVMVIIGLCSCATRRSDRTEVYRDWSQALGELGIFPVFPPREDVQAGDIYALPLHPYSSTAIEYVGGLGKVGALYDRVDVSKPLTEFYDSSIYPADTTNSYLGSTSTSPVNNSSADSSGQSPEDGEESAKTNSGSPMIKVPALTASQNVFSNGNVLKLRQVAFPEFTYTGIDQGTLAAMVPIEAFSTKLGLTRNSIRDISVKIPAAESYSISTKELLQSIVATNETRKMTALKKLVEDRDSIDLLRGMRSQFNEALGNLKSLLPHSAWLAKPRRTGKLWREIRESRNHVWLVAVNEVYMARSIDISIHTTEASGLAATVQPVGLSELKNIAASMSGGEATSVTNIVKDLEAPTPEQGESEQGESEQGESEQGESEQGESEQGESEQGESEPGESEPGESEPGESEPGESEPGESEPGESEQSESEAEAIPVRPQVDIAITNTTSNLERALELAKRINAHNLEVANQSSIGGSVNIVSVSDSTIGLRKTYERPIVIGVRGLVVRVNVATGKVEEVTNTKRWREPRLGWTVFEQVGNLEWHDFRGNPLHRPQDVPQDNQ